MDRLTTVSHWEWELGVPLLVPLVSFSVGLLLSTVRRPRGVFLCFNALSLAQMNYSKPLAGSTIKNAAAFSDVQKMTAE